MTLDDPTDSSGRAQPPERGVSSGVTTTLDRGQVVSAITIVALVTIIAFETMAISTVMPAAGAALGVGGSYGLAFSSMFTAQLLGIVVAGTWIAARGASAPIITGQVLLGLGSLVAGIAPTFGVFLAGRVVAGCGAGLVLVAVYVAVGAIFRPAQRPAMFAWMSAGWVLPSIVGPLVGAWLTETVSWRATFLVVVPAVAAALPVLVRRHGELSLAGVDPQAAGRLDRRIVGTGAVVAAGAGLLQWGGDSLVPPSAVAVLAVGAGLVALAAVLPRALPGGTFRLRSGLPSVIAARFLATASFNSSVTYVPLFLVGIAGLTITGSGLVLALSSIGWAVGAAIQSARAFAGRQQLLVVAGATCCAVACAGYAGIALLMPTAHVSGWWMVVPSTLSGLGMGLVTASLSVLTLRIAPPDRHASASSALQLGDVLGSTLGLTLIGAVFASLVAAGVGSATGTGATEGGAGVPVFVTIWVVTAVIAACGVVAGGRIRA